LQRPECILAESDGSLWSADARGGVVHIRPDGSQRVITQAERGDFSGESSDADRFTQNTLSNSLAFARSGDILISNFGTDRLEIMTRSGETKALFDSLNGKPIDKVNFVLRDSRDRIWLTVSTTIANWMDAISPNICDGYIALADEKGLRIGADGTLTRRETFGPESHGAFIEGIAFDAFGNLWGTHVMFNRVFALTPQRDLRILLDDDNGSQAGRDPMRAFAEDRVTPELTLASGGDIAPWMARVTFGGTDLSTVYIGSLRGTRIPAFCAPASGLPMVHWNEGATT